MDPFFNLLRGLLEYQLNICFPYTLRWSFKSAQRKCFDKISNQSYFPKIFKENKAMVVWPSSKPMIYVIGVLLDIFQKKMREY